MTSPAPPVSVVILTLNEAINIADCIRSCQGCDDIHVVDSGSTDRTIEIARSHGVPVLVHPFTSFGAQRNWAIDHVPVMHDWVFHLDADERLTPELIHAMSMVLVTDPPAAGFYVPEKLMFMGQWLRRAGSYPKYQMRLFHKARMRFCDHGHGQRELTEGSVDRLDEPYLHYNFSKGLADWVDKHNHYSSLEAVRIVTAGRTPWSPGDMMAGDAVRRRRAWKAIASRVPARAFLRWFVILFVFGGIFEGRPARTYARLLALYEEMTALKVRLLRAGGSPRGNA
jgi:glycosyltransferase involved in cell wall biosynthesis